MVSWSFPFQIPVEATHQLSVLQILKQLAAGFKFSNIPIQKRLEAILGHFSDVLLNMRFFNKKTWVFQGVKTGENSLAVCAT